MTAKKPYAKIELDATQVVIVQDEEGLVQITVHNGDKKPVIYEASPELRAEGRHATATVALRNVTPRDEDDIPF